MVGILGAVALALNKATEMVRMTRGIGHWILGAVTLGLLVLDQATSFL